MKKENSLRIFGWQQFKIFTAYNLDNAGLKDEETLKKWYIFKHFLNFYVYKI